MSAPVRSGKTIAAFASQCVLATTLAASAAAQDKLALVGGMLLDGYDVPPLHHAAVVIEGERIVAVGRAAELEIPADARVVDTSGRVMIPGMMDLHAHLAILGHGEYGRWFSWVDEPELVVKEGKVYRRDQPPVRRQP